MKPPPSVRDAAVLALPSLALAAALFAAFGFHSYHPTDYGFILAYAWRIANGEIPYVDFLYLRPPGSLYLHSLWMWLPDGFAFAASRLAFYLELAASGLLPALAAQRVGLVRSPATVSCLSVAFLALAIHNFPVMAWYSVDGIFFASAGLCALLLSLAAPSPRQGIRWRIAASIAFVFALLCKQSFGGAAAAFGGYALLEMILSPGNRRRHALARLAASALPALSVIALLLCFLAAHGAVSMFWDQVTTGTNTGGLLAAGFDSYASFGALWALLIGLSWPWLCKLAREPRPHATMLADLLSLVLLAAFALVVWQLGGFAKIGRCVFVFLLGASIGRLLLAGPAIAAGTLRERERLQLIVSFGILTIAWSSSLSWGYPKPTLGLAAAALVAKDLLPHRPERWPLQVALAAVTLLVVSHVWAASSAHPYRDVHTLRQTSALHEIFPRFGRLHSNPGLASELRELKQLAERHALARARPFTVLRDHPLIHYLVGARNPARLDWYFHEETQGRGMELLRELLDLDAVFLLYRKRNTSTHGDTRGFGGECSARDFDHSPMLKRPVYNAGTLLESGKFFCVVELTKPAG